MLAMFRRDIHANHKSDTDPPESGTKVNG